MLSLLGFGLLAVLIAAVLFVAAAYLLPSGEQLFLPYYLRPCAHGIAAPYKTVCPTTHQVGMGREDVRVAGWPRPVGAFSARSAALGLSGFVFNGQTVDLTDGGYLATLYGFFERSDFEAPARMNLVAAASPESSDSSPSSTSSMGTVGRRPSRRKWSMRR